jgi:excisionase family DNA binding protein
VAREKKKRSRTDERSRVMRRVYPAASDRPRFLESKLLRAGEVAALLQVSRRSVAAWARRGLLSYIETPGGHRRFRAADVRALVANLRCVAAVDDLPFIPDGPPPVTRALPSPGSVPVPPPDRP